MTPAPMEHGRVEDALALAIGSILIAIGLAILRAAGLVTGGMAGLSLLVAHFVPVTPGVLFALLNIPFFVLAFVMLGGLFTIRTVLFSVAIALMSLLVAQAFHIDVHHAVIAAIAGGILLGMGTLSAVRHGTGVGGVGVLTIWLHQTRGWNIGRTQILIDCVILGTSALFLPARAVGLSVVSAVSMGAIVYMWHRPGLYSGFSLSRFDRTPSAMLRDR